jgi:Glycosyltransferase family 87
VALASVTGPIAMALASVRYAVVYPQSSDFAGVAATHQAQSAALGCIYSRSVQLAGAHLVPGLVAPSASADLIWHFNEPPLMTLLAAPFAGLRISSAVNVWEAVLSVALAACAFLLWRRRNGLPHWLVAAVVAALLLNEIANTEFSLAQNDALLLLAALVALDMLSRHRDIAAGVLLGLVALKPQLIFLAVIALVIHQRWRVVAVCAATVAAIGALSVLMVGPSCSLQWLGSATKLGEFQIGIGLPGTLARWTGSTTAAVIGFLILAIIAVVVLIRIRRRVDTPLLAAVAVALAVVIGLHTLAYDVLFLAPLGMAVARSNPWSVVAAGWAFTLAQLIYPRGVAPVLATEVVPFVAVTLAILLIVRNGAPSEERPDQVSTGSHQHLVAAT